MLIVANHSQVEKTNSCKDSDVLLAVVAAFLFCV